MKHTFTKIFLLSIFVSCTPDQLSQLSPTNSTTPPVGSVTPVTTPTVPASSYIEQIKNIAGTSSCANYNFKNRGKAPVGYIKGMALSFARSVCRLNTPASFTNNIIDIMSQADSNNDAKDALTHYQSNLSFSGLEPLLSIYTIGIGLGMRESSGTYCENWDVAAGSNRSSSAAEAGLFQTSLDSMNASVELSNLYNEYKSTSSGRCFLDSFKEGVSCSTNKTLGTGAGADFQNFTKSCPAFATEYAMTVLRILRAHYGPINRREAEVVPACEQMLVSVQELVNADPEIACAELD